MANLLIIRGWVVSRMIVAYILTTLLIVLILGLNEFHLVFYVLLMILTVMLLIRFGSNGNQTNYFLIGIGLFLIGFLLARIFESILMSEHRKKLEVFFNEQQFGNIVQGNHQQKNAISNTSVYNIFFVETNPDRDKFSWKQLCAIESAAKNNRNANIHVLSIKSQLTDELSSLIELYPNIHIEKFKPIDVFEATPLLEWWKSGVVFESRFSTVHIADAARLALLWKHGGVYSDLDMLMIKSLQPLVAAQKSGVAYSYEGWHSITNSLMIFTPKHHFISLVLNEFARNYTPSEWATNGPALILRTLKRVCHVEDIRDMTNKSCPGLTLFPEEFFAPFRYYDGELKAAMFETNSMNAVDMSKLTQAYTIHYNGHLTKDVRISTKENTLFGLLASSNCQFVYDYLNSHNLFFE